MPRKYQCKDKKCKWHHKVVYASHRFVFKHYYNKGREDLIKLAIETGVSNIPYQEPTYILADKLVKISKVDEE